MFSADHDPTILKLENDAAENVELSSRTLGAVVMDADDAAILAFEHVQQVRPKGPAGLSAIAAELGAHCVAPLATTGDRAKPRGVPRGMLVE